MKRSVTRCKELQFRGFVKLFYLKSRGLSPYKGTNRALYYQPSKHQSPVHQGNISSVELWLLPPQNLLYQLLLIANNMPNYITWQILHVLCIIAHIGLIIDAAAVLAVGEYWSIQDDSSSNSLISYGVCSWAATGIVSPCSSDSGVFFRRILIVYCHLGGLRSGCERHLLP